jgi:tetratricopeptide (TPR) repeat protein
VAGAAGREWDLSVIQRALIAGRAIWFYAAKLVWPSPLIFIYPRWKVDAASWGSYLYPLAVLAVLAFLWRLKDILGRGVLAGVLVFLVNLFPALGFINVFPMRYTFVADHYQYMASMGVIALFAAGAARFFERLENAPPAFWAGFVSLLGLNLGLATFRETKKYENAVVLWRDTLAKNPDSSIAYNNLGAIYLKAQDLPKALENFQQALRAKPSAESYYNVANVLAHMGDYSQAMGYYRESIRIGPEMAVMHNDLANCWLAKGNVTEAIAEYRKALALEPDAGWIRQNLEKALKRAGLGTGAGVKPRRVVEGRS